MFRKFAVGIDFGIFVPLIAKSGPVMLTVPQPGVPNIRKITLL
jgi:hypothetical protein